MKFDKFWKNVSKIRPLLLNFEDFYTFWQIGQILSNIFENLKIFVKFRHFWKIWQLFSHFLKIWRILPIFEGVSEFDQI